MLAYTEHDVRTHFDLLDNTVDNVGRLFRHVVVMFAKVVGSLLPMIAEKIGVDPAVMASPLISTITDAVSLLIYFSIAKMFLHF